LAELRKCLVSLVPHLEAIDEVVDNEWRALEMGALGTGDFSNVIQDFYRTNPIARSSEVMAALSAAAQERQDNRQVAAE